MRQRSPSRRTTALALSFPLAGALVAAGLGPASAAPLGVGSLATTVQGTTTTLAGAVDLYSGMTWSGTSASDGTTESGSATAARTDTQPMSANPAGPFDPTQDMGSMHNVARIVGADAAWRAGVTGAGVDVALIDTGVSPVPGLDSGNVVDGIDFSFDSQIPELAGLDAHGHGTHLAGVIVGREAASPTPGGYAGSPAAFTGIAPDARVVDVKVGASDGAVDVSQVIAAVTWVTEHAQDPGYNIRVIALAYGTDSTQAAPVDPLAHAVEQAWKAGIVVVVAAGNDGRAARLALPAYDPYVIAVGASDAQLTVDTSDDTVPDFSSKGDSERHVDVVAPGTHVASLRVPGSLVDDEHPSALVTDRYLRGSGTSQAAAVVAGTAALMLQANPELGPDQVKRTLMAQARAFPSASAQLRGAGLVDAHRAATARPSQGNQSDSFYGSGTGSLDAARGTYFVSDGVNDLRGEQDIFGNRWDGAAYADASAAGLIWQGTSFLGSSWSGWSGSSWAGKSWSGKSWSGSSWSGKSWSGKSWSGSSWSGKSWSGKSWSGRTWADASWA